MCISWCDASGCGKKAIITRIIYQTTGIVLADLFTGSIFALIPGYSQKDEWFVDIVLKCPPTKDVGISGQDMNCLIDIGLRFAGDKNSGFVTGVHRMAHRFKDAARISPTISAILEARVLQQVIQIFGVEDTRYRAYNEYKNDKDCYSGTFQFSGYFLGRCSYISSSRQLVKSSWQCLQSYALRGFC